MAAVEIIVTENVSVRVMELDEGTATPWHYHNEVDDYFVSLNGRVRVEAKGPVEEVELCPGQRVEISSKRIHRVVNLHKGRSEYLLVQGIGKYDFIAV